MSRPPFLHLPAGVRSGQVPTPRGPLAALVADPPDDREPGAPALLVPGYTGSKEDFIAVLAPLAAAGHPVLAIDQRGQFESPGDDDPSSYDLEVLADDVHAVLAGLGRPAHLVGHSFGGLVSQVAAVGDPRALLSLTLMSSGPAAVPAPADANISLLAQALAVMDLEAIWVAKRQIEAQTEAVPPTPEVEEWMRRRFLANHPASLRRIAEHLLTAVDGTDEVAALGLPTLVLVGDDDDVWPPELQMATAARLGARIARLPGVGHSPAADAPAETVAALLGFWSGVRPP